MAAEGHSSIDALSQFRLAPVFGHFGEQLHFSNANVMMLVANPRFKASTVSVTTTTTQVAPTIVKALGLDPTALDAVRAEGTPVLPEVLAQLAKK